MERLWSPTLIVKRSLLIPASKLNELLRLLISDAKRIASDEKAACGFAQACKVILVLSEALNCATSAYPPAGMFKALPKSLNPPSGTAAIVTPSTGLPPSKLTFPVITAAGFRYPIPVM